MATFTKDTVKPSQLEINHTFCGSDLGDGDEETVAANIVYICRQAGDTWIDFTWKEFEVKRRFAATPGDYIHLDSMVRKGLLSFVDEKYQILDTFIALLSKFIIKK